MIEPSPEAGSESGAKRERRASWSMTFALVGLGSLLGLLTIPPLFARAPAALWNLDPSWQESLGLAILNHLQFGTEYLWTYGPLGFLHDAFVYPSTALTDLTAGVNVAAHIGYVVAFLLFADLVRRQWQSGRLVGALVLVATALAAYWSATSFDVGDILMMLSLLAAATCITRPSSRYVPYLAGMSGALLGLAALYKASFIWAAILQLLLMTVVFLLGDRGLRRGVGPGWGAFAVAFILAWLATGQDLADIGSFVVGSWQLSIGYSANLSLGIDWHKSVAIAVLGILGTLSPLLLLRWRQALLPQVGLALMTIPFIFVSWKDAVVRMEGGGLADPRIISLFLIIVAVGCLVMLMSSRLFSLSAGGPALAAAVCAGLAVGQLGPLLGEPWILSRIGTNRYSGATYTAVSLPWYDSIPAREIAKLRGYTVNAIPWDVDLVVDNHLRWDPLPVPQTYSAYTTYLDRLDAEQLNSRRGASRIVASFTEIDGRYELWDPPLVWQTLLTHYSCESITGISAILKRGPERLGVTHPIEHLVTSFGHWIAVPKTTFPLELVRVKVTSSLEGETIGVALRQTSVVVEFRLSNGRVTRPYRFEPTDSMDGEYISRFVTGPRGLCDVMAGRGEALPSIVGIKLLTAHPSQWSRDIGIQFVGRA